VQGNTGRGPDVPADFKLCILTSDIHLKHFAGRFADVNNMQTQLTLFNNPLKCNIPEQRESIKLELCDLQSDPLFQSRHETGIDFLKLVSSDKFPELSDFSKRTASMFGSTYICEYTFSSIKAIKYKQRNRLTSTFKTY
jgi:hypothetical protein